MTGIKLEPAKPADLPRLVELLGVLFASEAEFAADAQKQRAGLQQWCLDTLAASVRPEPQA